jgi:pimeloyl-ACP methyl ester carboxylesterase
MRGRAAIWMAAFASALLLAAAAPAEARQQWRQCLHLRGARCTTVAVPLDRSGAVAGRVGLRVLRLRAAGPKPYLMYLSGGPGGAGVLEMLSVLFGVPELAGDFTLLGFDQRGTGRSGLLRCRALERDPRLRSTTAAARCAAGLGRRRAFYTTPDSVEDMEAIRRAAGAPKLTLFGVSYGTSLALAYARAHPDRVERMILDSVVDPDDADPFALASFRAMVPSLRSLCPARCRGLSTDPAADLTALIARLRAAPLSGDLVRADGSRLRQRLRPIDIADLMFDADYDPALRAGVPMAVRAALDHDDAAPMLRLLDAARGLAGPFPPREFSAARYATVCEEAPLPWPRGTPPVSRFDAARALALSLPPSAFAPLDAEAAYGDLISLCLRWPDPVRPPPARGGAYPAVPTLLLGGEEDVRTPPEVSARVAARIPGARRVTVPGIGHAVVAADPSGCGRRQLLRFLADRAGRARCPRVATGVPPTAVPPTALAQLPPAAGLSGRVGRTVSAVDATLDFLDFARSPALHGQARGGGLRGGRYAGARRLRLHGFVVVPGVRIGGAQAASGALRLRVRGAAAAHGTVRVTRRGRLSGRLGGQRVRARLVQAPRGAFAGRDRVVRHTFVRMP